MLMLTNNDEQYDDHIWIKANDEAWAIQSIERDQFDMVFLLWRGYAPEIEYATIVFPLNHDWSHYCKAAALMLINFDD
jgi:hypothetical protein